MARVVAILSLFSVLITGPTVSVADCKSGDPRYKVHDDGTVADTDSGLMWKRCVEGVSGNDCSSRSWAIVGVEN